MTEDEKSLLAMFGPLGKLSAEDLAYLDDAGMGSETSQPGCPADSGYLSLDQMRELAEPSYLSVSEMQTMASLFHGQSSPQEEKYLSIGDMQELAGHFQVKLDEAGDEAGFLSMDQMQRLAGVESFNAWVVTTSTSQQTQTLATVMTTSVRTSACPDYMSMTELQSALRTQLAHDSGYLSLDEARQAVKDLQEKIAARSDADYMTVEDMQALASPAAFKAFVCDLAAPSTARLSKEPSTGAAQVKQTIRSMNLLRNIRDEIIRHSLRQCDEQETKDAIFARELQRRELQLGMEEEEAVEWAQLQALERVYLHVTPHKDLTGESFALLRGYTLYDAHDNSQADPDFAMFEAHCAKAAKELPALLPILDRIAQQDLPAVFYGMGKVVKAMEHAVNSLGAAGSVDLGSGIRKAHLHKLTNCVWLSTRKVTRRLGNHRHQAQQLRIWAARLYFVLNRLSGDHEPIVVDETRIRRQIRARTLKYETASSLARSSSQRNKQKR